MGWRVTGPGASATTRVTLNDLKAGSHDLTAMPEQCGPLNERGSGMYWGVKLEVISPTTDAEKAEIPVSSETLSRASRLVHRRAGGYASGASATVGLAYHGTACGVRRGDPA